VVYFDLFTLFFSICSFSQVLKRLLPPPLSPRNMGPPTLCQTWSALLCQDHTQNFRTIAHSSKKIETPKVYCTSYTEVNWQFLGLQLSTLDFYVLNPQFLSQIVLKVGLLYHTFGGLTNFYYILTCLFA
jgi:hypothetical protein